MARLEQDFVVNDKKRGRVRFRVIDRLSPDDVVVHLVERELYRLAGGGDPGDDVNQEFQKFIIHSGAIPGE